MRLQNEEIEHILQAITPFLGENHAELRLYGSRVHDEKKGGDIDLLLLTDNDNLTEELLQKKHYLISNIKKRLGDQKIDLLITNRNTIQTIPFITMTLPTSIFLKKW